MTPEERQLSDAISIQIQALKSLVDGVNALRANRKVLDLRIARIGTLTNQNLANAGHGHLTVEKVLGMAAAMDQLDTDFVSPMEGTDPNTAPITRILDFLP